MNFISTKTPPEESGKKYGKEYLAFVVTKYPEWNKSQTRKEILIWSNGKWYRKYIAETTAVENDHTKVTHWAHLPPNPKKGK